MPISLAGEPLPGSGEYGLDIGDQNAVPLQESGMGPQSKQVDQGRIFLVGVVVGQVPDVRQLHVVPSLVIHRTGGCYIAECEQTLGHVLHGAEARDAIVLDGELWPEKAGKLSRPSGGIGVSEIVGRRTAKDVDQLRVSDLAFV